MRRPLLVLALSSSVHAQEPSPPTPDFVLDHVRPVHVLQRRIGPVRSVDTTHEWMPDGDVYGEGDRSVSRAAVEALARALLAAPEQGEAFEAKVGITEASFAARRAAVLELALPDEWRPFLHDGLDASTDVAPLLPFREIGTRIWNHCLDLRGKREVRRIEVALPCDPALSVAASPLDPFLLEWTVTAGERAWRSSDPEIGRALLPLLGRDAPGAAQVEASTTWPERFWSERRFWATDSLQAEAKRKVALAWIGAARPADPISASFTFDRAERLDDDAEPPALELLMTPRTRGPLAAVRWVERRERGRAAAAAAEIAAKYVGACRAVVGHPWLTDWVASAGGRSLRLDADSSGPASAAIAAWHDAGFTGEPEFEITLHDGDSQNGVVWLGGDVAGALILVANLPEPGFGTVPVRTAPPHWFESLRIEFLESAPTYARVSSDDTVKTRTIRFTASDTARADDGADEPVVVTDTSAGCFHREDRPCRWIPEGDIFRCGLRTLPRAKIEEIRARLLRARRGVPDLIETLGITPASVAAHRAEIVAAAWPGWPRTWNDRDLDAGALPEPFERLLEWKTIAPEIDAFARRESGSTEWRDVSVDLPGSPEIVVTRSERADSPCGLPWHVEAGGLEFETFDVDVPRALAPLLDPVSANRRGMEDVRAWQKSFWSDENFWRDALGRAVECVLAENACRDLPAWDELARRFRIVDAHRGDFWPDIGDALHLTLDPGADAPVNRVEWYVSFQDDVLKGDGDALLVHWKNACRLVDSQRWLVDWKRSLPGRRLSIVVTFERADPSERSLERLALPWHDAGFDGEPEYEIQLLQDGEWAGSVLLGRDEARALITCARPPRDSEGETRPPATPHWFDALDFEFDGGVTGTSRDYAIVEDGVVTLRVLGE